MPPRKQPGNLEDHALRALGDYFMGVVQCVIDLRKDPATPPRIIQTERLHEYIHVLPSTLSIKVTDRLLKRISALGRQVAEKLITATLSPHLQILDMTEYPRYIRRILISCVHKYEMLHTLSCHLKEETMYILYGLSSLKCLVKFQMRGSCTDAVIILLGLNIYKTIEHVDVRNSKSVTDASFETLIKCRKLKELLISDTSMTAEGYVAFLQYKKTDVTAAGFVKLSVGRSSELGFSREELDETVAACPMLRVVYIVNLRGDLAKLCNLTQLNVVQIFGGDALQCHLDGFLRARGSNLTFLELRSVTSLDFTCIVNHCHKLQTLDLSDCSITDSTLDNRQTAKSLRNLKKLYLKGKFPRHLVEHILSSCIDIRRLNLYLYSEAFLTDDHLLRLLHNAHFQKLNLFHLGSDNNNLSLTTVNAIIAQCPLLQTLENLSNWKGVTPEQIDNLRKEMSDNNLDLNIPA